MSDDRETIAEVQESQEWADLKPVGSKYFVGRERLTQELYRFVKAPLDDAEAPRVFFVEGKSGWGKSSLLTHLRARAEYRRNRKTFFVLAVDSRSANTSAFVGLALTTLVNRAAQTKFVPEALAAEVRIPSWFDVLSDPGLDGLLQWLHENNRVLVLAFDQFEDVFRKHDLFRAFHKLMIDVAQRRANLVIGFSRKSEINIPMDNPAYGLWQQARAHAVTFDIERFGAPEIDRVIQQLQQESGQALPTPLKRRLREGAQGFPWLIKKLATHCYHELNKGLSPDDLVDQDLNVKELFDRDRESLTPEETRALQLIAQRGYDGDPFDMSEVDDRIDEEVLNRLLAKRLVVRTGAKYNVYWDIFRDYVVEGNPPRLDESFLLRQYPKPCVAVLNLLSEGQPKVVADVCAALGVGEGTALNLLREMRSIGAVAKHGDHFVVRTGIDSEASFQAFMKNRLGSHVVVRALRKKGTERIEHEHLTQAVRDAYRGFTFTDKTWGTYASFFGAWLRYCDIDLGRRLAFDPRTRGTDPKTYTPQSRPDRVLEMLEVLASASEPIQRPTDKKTEKPLYDLKALGLLTYGGNRIYLTRIGKALLNLDREDRPSAVGDLALNAPKVRAAVEALRAEESGDADSFEAGLESLLHQVRSPSYRKVTTAVLKAWARFIAQHVPDAGASSAAEEAT